MDARTTLGIGPFCENLEQYTDNTPTAVEIDISGGEL
jgi:hypothetical protein